MNIKKSFQNLNPFERILWGISLLVVTISYCFGSRDNILTLFASLIGVTALIFVAKGDVLGQILTLLFSILYAIISYECAYFGEMITYLFMTSPAALLAIISWLKHPYKGNRQEVKVNQMKKQETFFMLILTSFVTWIFYYILKHFNTAQLPISTVSVTTSFLASYLTFRRNHFYALAYAANDLVLIALWILASIQNPAYLPVILCFLMFLVNDMYGFVNWQRMKKQQQD